MCVVRGVNGIAEKNNGIIIYDVIFSYLLEAAVDVATVSTKLQFKDINFASIPLEPMLDT